MRESPANPKESPLPGATERGQGFVTSPFEGTSNVGTDVGDVKSFGVVHGWGGEGMPTTAERAAACSVPLPCLNRNNSTEPPPKRYAGKQDPNAIVAEGWAVRTLADGRTYLEDKSNPGVHLLCDTAPIPSADRKRAFVLRAHVDAFVAHWGREHSLFFTLTDGEGVGPKEYARRWNSLLAHESDWISAFIRVLEPQRNGRPHFHNLTAVPWDTQPDRFDWDAFTRAEDCRRAGDMAGFRAARRAYVESAAPELRKLWAWSRRVLPRYGLGRAEILPVRKVGAIAEYIGKYLDKGMALKIDRWRGVRRFETDRRTSTEWKRCGSRFSWASPGAKEWRLRVGEVARSVGADVASGDLRAISRRLGPRWAYRIRGAIFTSTAAEWAEILASFSRQFGVAHQQGSGAK